MKKKDGKIVYTHISTERVDGDGVYRIWWNDNYRVASEKIKDFNRNDIKVWENPNIDN